MRNSLKEKCKGFAKRENSGLEEVSSRVPPALVLERILCNVFIHAFSAKVISVLETKQNKTQLGAPVNAEEDCNSILEDTDGGVPGIV